MLHRDRITRGLFVLLLLVQIGLLSPAFSWPHISVGDFTARAEKETLARPRTVQQALFASYQANEKTGIIFTGDVLLARNVEFLIQREGGSYPLDGVPLTELLPGAAIVGNFEAAIPKEHQPTPSLAMRFSVNPSFLPALASAGFTHFSQANNHSFDYGEEGFYGAKEALLASGLVPFGNGRTLNKDSITYINTTAGRVSLIGIHASEVIPARSTLKTVMANASRQSDLQIVYIHWGTEYKLVHNSAQEEIATTLVEYGADLIIGHHPHVVQDVQVIDGVVVFYSLGNYIFDQYFNQDVQEGLVVGLTFVDSEASLRLLPVSSIGTLSQPWPMKEEKRRQFLLNLAKRSDEKVRDQILDGVLPLPSLVASSEKMAIMVR